MSDYDREDDTAKEARAKKYRDLHPETLPAIELVKRMAEAKARKEVADEAKKEADSEYDVLRIERVPSAFEREGIENARYEGIGRVSLTGDMWVKVGDKLAFFGWLGKNKLKDLIQPTVNASTLKAFVKDRIKKGKTVPESLKVTAYTRASITKG